jgi:general secretion pathway protein H
MTLIEMMIVVIIVALAASGASYAFGAIERTQMRSACMKIGAASRYAYNRAISRGTTVRLLFDLDAETLAFEEGHGRLVIARSDDARRRDVEREADDGADASAVDPWAAARARLESTLHPSFGASPFQPIEGARYASRRLGDRITIDRLITPHEPEPRTSGRGSIYFFPGGQTEHAVVWVGDGRDRVFAVELHPLTGRVRVHDRAYEPDELLDDGADEPESEVRD